MNRIASFDPDRFVSAEPRAKPTPLHPMPKLWEHGLQMLAERPLPRGASADRWAQILADANRICTVWQAVVAAAGWSIENLFGLDLRDGRESLAVAARGRPLIRMDAVEAALRTSDGVFFVRPSLSPGTPLLWNFNERDLDR